MSRLSLQGPYFNDSLLTSALFDVLTKLEQLELVGVGSPVAVQKKRDFPGAVPSYCPAGRGCGAETDPSGNMLTDSEELLHLDWTSNIPMYDYGQHDTRWRRHQIGTTVFILQRVGRTAANRKRHSTARYRNCSKPTYALRLFRCVLLES